MGKIFACNLQSRYISTPIPTFSSCLYDTIKPSIFFHIYCNTDIMYFIHQRKNKIESYNQLTFDSLKKN